jgi:hypothetical protein
VSQNFQTGDLVLWNPSHRVAELFVRSGQAIASLIDRPTGIGEKRADEYEIDLDLFVGFVDALVEQYLSSSHPILRSLTEGFLAVALVMVERAGRTVSWRGGFDRRDVLVGSDGVGAGGDRARLRELADRAARGMPR